MIKNKSKSHILAKAILFCFLPVVLSALISCAGPVSIGPFVAGANHCGMGIYDIEDRLINPAVHYFKAKGFGIIIIDKTLYAGYTEYQIVHGKVDSQSYYAETPIAKFAVGKETENFSVEMLKN